MLFKDQTSGKIIRTPLGIQGDQGKLIEAFCPCINKFQVSVTGTMISSPIKELKFYTINPNTGSKDNEKIIEIGVENKNVPFIDSRWECEDWGPDGPIGVVVCGEKVPIGGGQSACFPTQNPCVITENTPNPVLVESFCYLNARKPVDPTSESCYPVGMTIIDGICNYSACSCSVPTVASSWEWEVTNTTDQSFFDIYVDTPYALVDTATFGPIWDYIDLTFTISYGTADNIRYTWQATMNPETPTIGGAGLQARLLQGVNKFDSCGIAAP